MLLGKLETAFILEQLGLRQYQLTDWERGFLLSVTEAFGRGEGLTPKQQDTLSRIWDKN